MTAKKPEPFRFNTMTKAELIRTVKALDRRQTKMLNRTRVLEDELTRVNELLYKHSGGMLGEPAVGRETHTLAIAKLCDDAGVVHVTQSAAWPWECLSPPCKAPS